VKTAGNVVLKRLSATAERYIVYVNPCIHVRSCENQGSPYHDGNYLSSSRKDQENRDTVKIQILYIRVYRRNLKNAQRSSFFKR
jgi:hypothetical protein